MSEPLTTAIDLGTRAARAARRLCSQVPARGVAGALALVAALGGIGLLGWSAWTVLIAAVIGAAALSLLTMVADPASPPEALAAVAPAPPVPLAPVAPIWPAMLDGLPDAAMVLDRDGHVLGANAIARALLPIVEGRHLSRSSRSPELLDTVATVVRERRQATCQPRLVNAADRAFTALVTPLGANGGLGVPSVLIVIRDLTEQEQLARLRADFVANASHELRTPLTTLKGFVETLAGPARDDPAARERFLGIMGDQANRMARLIDDLLSLSRVEMNEHVSPSGTVDLDEIVADVLRALAPLAERAGVRLVPPADGAAFTVPGDRDELMQVIQNLVQNGIKYGRRGGKVELRFERRDSRIGLAVVDDGIGIAPEHLPRLTERFYRVSAKDSRERGGTGLGLAIVKHIVNRHRGALDIRSTVGHGSTFTIWLPAAPEAVTNL